MMKKPRIKRGQRVLYIKPIKRRGKRIRKAHYRIIGQPIIYKRRKRVKISKPVIKVIHWQSVISYQRELRKAWDLLSSDPIYRYNPQKDFINIMDHHSFYYLLVWGKPVKKDIEGNYRAGRVWYIVRDDKEDLYYLYSRTIEFAVTQSSLSLVRKELYKLQNEIMEEYADKTYMEFKTFVGWTAFVQIDDAPRVHKKRRFMSKEKSYAYDKREKRFFRDVTPWEKIQILKSKKLLYPVPRLAAKPYKTYKHFQQTLKRAPKKDRRLTLSYMSHAVRKLEKALAKKRRLKR